jgi:hypothetical protein
LVDRSIEALQARLDADRLQNERHEQIQSAFGELPRLLTLRH